MIVRQSSRPNVFWPCARAVAATARTNFKGCTISLIWPIARSQCSHGGSTGKLGKGKSQRSNGGTPGRWGPCFTRDLHGSRL